jgi:hypothetical protein
MSGTLTDAPRETSADPARASRPSAVDPLYLLIALEVTLGAFLLFQIQPLVAKVLLPKFGGAAAVWVTCAVFFQCALYLGYLAVDRLSVAISPRYQIIVFSGLLIAAGFFSPLTTLLQSTADQTLQPTVHILFLLGHTVGLPFIALSMTSSLCQHWLHTFRDRTPYHLYALSNGASFLALLTYPFLIEPRFDLPIQMSLWQSVLWLMAFGAIGIYITALRSKEPAPVRQMVQVAQPSVRSGDELFWIATSAFGVMLLLSTTHHLSADIAPVPLLWVLPLALYLATFTVAFGSLRSDYLKWCLPLYILALFSYLGAAYLGRPALSMLSLLVTMTLGCLVCHTELARSRPAPQALPRFYRQLALGGALGGLFVGIGAPLIFSQNLELILAIAAPLLVHRWSLDRQQSTGPVKPLPLFVLLALGICLLTFDRTQQGSPGQSNLITRNFYGVLKVTERTQGPSAYREFSHGSTIHGIQRIEESQELDPTTYYGPTSAIGRVLRTFSGAPISVGVVGLGIGTVAAYARPGDRYHFVELNPTVHQIAQERFTFLSKSRGTVTVSIGDGRLEFERWDSEPFDVIFLDAFSGDAIPTHLLTDEAIRSYLTKLKPEGVLVFHISNFYIDLAPVLATIAHKAELHSALLTDGGMPSELRSPSDSVIITRNQSFLNHPEIAPATTPIERRTRLWTDRYSSLWTVFKFPG